MIIVDKNQVGSHYHFIEVNPSLVFDRRKAYGMRLNIRAGTATRFEVELSDFHLLKRLLPCVVLSYKCNKELLNCLCYVNKYFLV